MRFSEDRQQILSQLTALAGRAPSLPIVRVLEGKRPANEHPAFFMEVPRLIIVLEGTGSFLTIENDQELLFDVGPGQVLFLAPCTWICPVPRSAYRSMGIILRSDSTRVTLHEREKMRPGGSITSRYLSQWRAGETLGEKGHHLIELLRQPPAERLGERTFMLLIELLLAEITALVEKALEHRRASQAVLWQSVCDYISEHWSDPELSREATARFFKRHPNHLSRFFHAHAKQNFRSYVNNIRLERSLHFLRDLRYNVTDVAILCGFKDLQYFIRCFRKRFGLTPGEYRNRKED
jgi:AraC-like DNA-binding protein